MSSTRAPQDPLFHLQQIYCCDPFRRHKKQIVKDLRVVGSKELASTVVKLYPGKYT